MAWVLSVLLVVSPALAPPPRLLRSFSAVLERVTWATETSYKEQTVGVVSADESSMSFLLPVHTPDGRPASTVQQFGPQRGLYQMEPFFDEHICYILDLDSPHKPKDALSEWLAEVRAQTLGIQEEHLWNATPGGTTSVDGRPCCLYTAEVVDGPLVTTLDACIGDAGELLASNSSTHIGGESFGISRLFRNFSAAAEIHRPAGCVDLRGGDRSSQQSPVNDASRLASIEMAADGRWHAGPSASFDGLSLAEVRQMLGTKGIRALSLPLGARLGGDDPHIAGEHAGPWRFDARERWPSCSSMTRIRDQGGCGSCWAMAAVDVLADRACVVEGMNTTLSVKYLLDCDVSDAGCDGGFVDNAWDFLVRVGVPSEECCPYRRDGMQWSERDRAASCPAACADGRPASLVQASSAYAVAQPGDAAAMQRELVANGPIHTAFFVFSDFISYKSGTYVRTSAASLQGAHSVRILGWGADKTAVNYWLVANSWGLAWGMGGFFHIVRGTNECGIETMPAAGKFARQAIV